MTLRLAADAIAGRRVDLRGFGRDRHPDRLAALAGDIEDAIADRDGAIDIVIVRENTEDLYSGLEHEVVKDVVESLKNKGAIFVEDLSEVPPLAVTVFSAHGVAKSVEEEAAARGTRLRSLLRGFRAPLLFSLLLLFVSMESIFGWPAGRGRT